MGGPGLRATVLALAALAAALAVAPPAAAHCNTLIAHLDVVGAASGDDPFTATLRLDATGDSDCTIGSWTLEWGDGTSVEGEGDPEGLQRTHTYHFPSGYQGSAYLYEARLVVREWKGVSSDDDQAQLTVLRPNQWPTAAVLATPTQGAAPLLVSFTLDADDADGHIASWTLTFRPGEQVSGAGSPAGVQRNHEYPAGSWEALLRVTDDRGGTAEATVALDVATAQENRPPSARLVAAPARGEAPLDVELRVEASDPDGNADLAAWTLDFGDGHLASGTGDPNGARLRHRFDAGEWAPNLVVRDARGASASATAEVRATVGGNLPPLARLEAEPEAGPAPLVVRFHAQARDLDGTLVRWSLDFGDGSPALTEDDPLDGVRSHTYLQAGVHAATLRAEDDRGAVTTAKVDVRVGSAPGARSPGLRLSAAPSAGPAPLEALVRLEAKPGFDRILSWDVDFGDGARAAGLGDPHGLALRHAFPDPGPFEVVARLTLASGLALEERAQVQVAAAPRPAATERPTLLLEAFPAVGSAPADVVFRARATSALRGNWSLDFGDGGALTFDGVASGVEVTHRYGRAFAGTVRVSVATAEGLVTADVPVRLLESASFRTASLEGSLHPALGLLPLAVLAAFAFAALGGPRGRALGVLAALLTVGTMPPVDAYMNLRHTESAAVYTQCAPPPEACDGVQVTWPAGTVGVRGSHGLLVLPDGTHAKPSSTSGDLSFLVNGGTPAPGTWSLAYVPTCEDPVAMEGRSYDVRWTLAGKTANVSGRGCTPTVWVWNWIPATEGSTPPGTILLVTGDRTLGPESTGFAFNPLELPEATFYTDAPPYYNLDGTPPSGPDADSDLDGLPLWREVLQHNSNPFSDRSRADTDDDGDGQLNIFDADPWWYVLGRDFGKPVVDVGTLPDDLPDEGPGEVGPDLDALPPPPRLDRLRATVLAHASDAADREGIRLVSPTFSQEPAASVWERTRETMMLEVTNLRPFTPGADRSLTEVQLRPLDHAPRLFIDVGATAFAAGNGWRVHADERADGVHAVRWSGLRIAPGETVALPVAVVAADVATDLALRWEVVTYDGGLAGDDVRAALVELQVLDDAAPPATALDPPLTLIRKDTVLRLAATDAGSGPDVTLAALDQQEPQETRAVLLPAPADGSADGLHRLDFRSVDRSGNEEPWRNATVLVDTQPPSTGLTVPPAPRTGPFTARLEAHDGGSGVAAVRWRLWLEGAARPSQALEGTDVRVERDGRWLLEYAAEDHAGNAEAPRLALLHLDGPDKLHLEATPAAPTVRPGEAATITVRARNLAGEPAAAARLVPAIPEGFSLVSASPPLRADGSWSLGTLGRGQAWEGNLTLRPPAATVGKEANLALRLEARFTTGLRNATLTVPLVTGPLQRLDLACPAEAASDARGTARVVCLLRNQGNVPAVADFGVAAPWTMEVRLPEEEGWPAPAEPLAHGVAVAPGDHRAVALLLRGGNGPAVVTARDGAAEATATVAVQASPLRGLQVEPASGGVQVRNVGATPETVQELGLLPPGAAAMLRGGATSERRVVWSGPALAAAARPAPVAEGVPVAGGLARPSLVGRVLAQGEEAVVSLTLNDLDGAPARGAVQVEGVAATLDAAGHASLRVATRRLVDGFVVDLGPSGPTWRFPSATGTAQGAWQVTVTPEGVAGRLTGLPPEAAKAPLRAAWTLRRGAVLEDTVAVEGTPEGLAFALAFPEGAQGLRLEPPAFAGALDLAGGGLRGTLVAVEATAFRAPARPVSLGLGFEGDRWTLALRNDAPWATATLRWELLDASGRVVAEGVVPAEIPASSQAQVTLALPAESLARASKARFTLGSADGWDVVLPLQPLAASGAADDARLTAASPVPVPTAWALLALLGAAAVLRRRRA